MLKKFQKALMTGVSYMLPLIVFSGFTIAVTGILSSYVGVGSEWVAKLSGFAWTIMGFMPAIFAAYCAYSIGDKPAIIPGFIGGFLANNPIMGSASGFLGGLVAGIAAGVIVHYLKKIKLPQAFISLKSVLIIPLVAGWAIYLLMAYPVGIFVGGLYTIIVDALVALAGNATYAFILGALISAMCASDMGGPLGKIAITVIFALWDTPIGFLVNAAAFPGIMIPAMSVGISALICKKKFTETEIKTAPAAIVTGLIGISEATLPYAFRDPIRTISANVIGGAVGGALMIMFKVTTPGVSGLIALPTVSNIPLFLLAIVIGLVISVAIQCISKKTVDKNAVLTEEAVSFDLEIL